MRLLTLFFIVISVGLLTQCKNQNSNSTTQDSSMQQLPEDFREFYEKFHRDSAFQMNHITFPLEGTRHVASIKGDTVMEYRWQKENWRMHRPFNNYDSLFTRKFYIVGDKIIIEKITGVNGLFNMERRFAKLNDGWNLIYYSVN